MESTQRLLTDAEAANVLQMTPRRVRRMVKAKTVPFILLPSGDVRFVESDLWGWIEQHKVQGTEARQ